MTRRLTIPRPDGWRTVVDVPAVRHSPAPSPDAAATGPVPAVRIGGRPIVVIAGPCAVEGRDMLLAVASRVAASGAAMLRGGAFKPRTSPYGFQGLGLEALEALDEARATTGLSVVTEVLDPRQVEFVATHADVLQIGARNMQNYALLAEVGRSHRPVLLKRGFAASLEELLQAAEHVMAAGNLDVILCERGIRGAASSTRFTLDVGAIPLLKAETHLPVIVDPSHAAGRADLVAAHASAAVAAGADGLLVEVHPDPRAALSDGPQSLSPDAFNDLMRGLGLVVRAVGRCFASPSPLPGAGSVAPRDALTRLREDIEAVDQELIQLIAQRVEIARHAGEVKRAAGLAVVDLAQESEVLERARPMAEAAGLPYREVRALLRGIIAVSRSAQRGSADPGPSGEEAS